MNYFLAAFKKYADFKGRSRRKEYWYFCLFVMIIAFGFAFGITMFSSPTVSSMVLLVFDIAIFVPSLAVGVRRMHDVDKSGWYLLIPIYSLILALTEGTPGANQYGLDPKRPEMLDEIEQIGTAATR